MLKAIHAQESRDAPEQKARMIIEELKARKMSKAAELVEQAVNETLTYYETLTYWQKNRTNNPLERNCGRNTTQDPRGRCVPGWPVLSQSRGSQAPAYRGNTMVNEALHEHAAPIIGRPTRSRCRMKKCAKDSGHYQEKRPIGPKVDIRVLALSKMPELGIVQACCRWQYASTIIRPRQDVLQDCF